MKKLSIFAAAAALAVVTAAPVVAQDVSADPFLTTQGLSAAPGIAIIAGVAVIIAIAAASDT